MKTCLKCMTTTTNDTLERCNICGGTEFRKGRPKTGYKMDPSENKGKVSNIREITEEDVNRMYKIGDYENKENIEYNDDISLGKWLVTFIVMSIPVVGLIYAIITIVKKNCNTTYLNYMKASIVMQIVALIASFVAGSLLTSFIANMMYSMY